MNGTPSGIPGDPRPGDPGWAGESLYTDERTAVTGASPQALWAVIEGIGGANGWYTVPLAWEARGLIDRLVGGPGLRRGRRDPRHLRVGDPVDFWRVEAVTPGSLLRLRAEKRLPGPTWLELTVNTDADGRTRYRQRSLFRPDGPAGHWYWRAVSPFHGLVFGAMARNIAAAAEGDGR
jgi:hypothetical protein